MSAVKKDEDDFVIYDKARHEAEMANESNEEIEDKVTEDSYDEDNNKNYDNTSELKYDDSEDEEDYEEESYEEKSKRRKSNNKEEESEDESSYYIDGSEEDDDKDSLLEILSENLRKERERNLLSVSRGFSNNQQGNTGLGEKPRDYDFNSTSDYEAALDKWYEKKFEIQIKENEQKLKQEEYNNRFYEKAGKFEKDIKENFGKTGKVYKELFDSVLDDTKKSIIIDKIKNPARFVYLLGKNPSVMSKLAHMDDIADFIIECNNIERSIKPRRAKPKTKPEKVEAKSVKFDVDSINRDKKFDKLLSEGGIIDLNRIKKNK
jgi:hypothetical protein